MFSFQLLERDMHSCTFIAAFKLISVCGYIVFIIFFRKADEDAANLMEVLNVEKETAESLLRENGESMFLSRRVYSIVTIMCKVLPSLATWSVLHVHS